MRQAGEGGYTWKNLFLKEIPMTTEPKNELKALHQAVRALRRFVTAELKLFDADIRDSRQRYRLLQRGNRDRQRFDQKCLVRAQYHRAGMLLAAADRAVHGLLQAPCELPAGSRWAMTVFQVMHRLNYAALQAQVSVLECDQLPFRVISGIRELPQTEALATYVAQQAKVLRTATQLPEPEAVATLLREQPGLAALETSERKAREPAEVLYTRITNAMPDLTAAELTLLSASLLGAPASL